MVFEFIAFVFRIIWAKLSRRGRWNFGHRVNGCHLYFQQTWHFAGCWLQWW